jgi:hypothetical protein
MNQTRLRWLFFLTISKLLNGLPPSLMQKGQQLLQDRPIKMVDFNSANLQKRSVDRYTLLQRSPELVAVPCVNDWFVVPLSYKFFKLPPDALEILEHFNHPISLNDALPNASNNTSSTVGALVEVGALVRHNVTRVLS